MAKKQGSAKKRKRGSTKKRYGGRIKNPVELLTKEEVEERFGEEVKWWDRCEVGDWGETNDGWCLKCIKVAERYKVFQGGYYASLQEKRFYVGMPAWLVQEMRMGRLHRTLDAYAAMVVETGRWYYNRDVESALGRLYRPDHAVPAATFRRLMGNRHIRREVGLKILNILAERGLGVETAATWMEEGAEMMKEKQDGRGLFGAGERLLAILERQAQEKDIEAYDEATYEIVEDDEERSLEEGRYKLTEGSEDTEGKEADPKPQAEEEQTEGGKEKADKPGFRDVLSEIPEAPAHLKRYKPKE